MKVFSIRNSQVPGYNWYHIENHHIFFNPDLDTIKTFLANYSRNHQRIHIFITSWNQSICNALCCLMDETIMFGFRISIYVPKKYKDIDIIMEDQLTPLIPYSDYVMYWPRCIILGKNTFNLNLHTDTFFVSDKESTTLISIEKATLSVEPTDEGFDVYFNIDIKADGYDSVWRIHTLHVSVNKNEWNTGTIFFSSKYRKDNPRLFKPEIVKDFKRRTPHNILKAFKDDNDILDWIIEQTKEEPKTSIDAKLDGEEMFDSDQLDKLAEQINDICNDMCNDIANKYSNFNLEEGNNNEK